MLKIYANGIQLKHFKITQGENGASHRKAVFGNGVSQNALDFAIPAGYVITCNKSVRASSRVGTKWRGNYDKGHYILISVDGWIITKGHTYKHARAGLVPTGVPICTIAPKGQNGGWKDATGRHSYGVHLHLGGMKNSKASKIRAELFRGRTLREVLNEDRPDTKKVDAVTWFIKFGEKEARRRLTKLGREDVLKARSTTGGLIDWIVDHSQKEYGNMWRYDKTIKQRAVKVVDKTAQLEASNKNLLEMNRDLMKETERLDIVIEDLWEDLGEHKIKIENQKATLAKLNKALEKYKEPKKPDPISEFFKTIIERFRQE